MSYHQRPVFSFPVDWSQGITRRMVYDLRTQQIGFGPEVDEQLQQYTADGFTIGLDLATPCDINALERFFAKVFGRLQGFWLPSPAWQFDIVASVSASEFLVKNAGLANSWADLPALHLYLRPDSADTGETAQVTAVTAVDDQTERVTLSAALSSGVPDSTWVAQRLLYVRLVNDTLTLDFQYEGRAKTTFDVLEMPVEYASVELGDRPAFGYHFWRIVAGVRKDWYYTSFERELSIGSVAVQTVCTPAPISHAEITRTTAGDREQVEINSWRFDGSPLEAWQPFAPQYDLFMEIWEVDLGGGQPSVATTVFAGLVETVQPNGRALKVTCSTRLDRLNMKLPRFRVQSACNYLLYGPCCKVPRAPYSVAATVVSGDAVGLALVLQDAGLAGKALNWFQFGDAETTDEEGLPQYRTITGSTVADGNQLTITLNAPFNRVINVGDTVTIAAGCDLQFTSANGCPKFANQINFGGHPHIAENISLTAIPLSTDGAGKGGGK